MRRVLITGATGWIGSLVTEVLVRAGHAVTAIVRGAAIEGVTCIRGDITAPRAGWDDDQVAACRDAIDVVIHLAALVRLDATSGAALALANVDGTRHVLALAEALNVPRFIHVSSASVAGDAAAFTETDRDAGQTLRNDYERTKLRAEHLVAARMGETAILRVPGVVGDSQTGVSRSYDGTFYRALAAYFFVREDLAAEWRGGERAAMEHEGIRFDPGGVLALPVELACERSGPCAVVPQDWLAETIAAVALDPAAIGTFHLVQAVPPTIGWALEVALARLGIELAPPGPGGPWTRFARRSLDRIARHQLPYMTATPRLTCSRLPTVRGYAPCPSFDRAAVERLVDRAVEARFA
ncbi:MAG: SDR family oxidoreductase [Kofleriaceae bacterium]